MNTLKSKAINEIRATIETLTDHPECADRIEGLQVLLGELEAEQGGKGVLTVDQIINEAIDSAGGLTNDGTTYERLEHIEGFKQGYQRAISQMQPEWVSVEDRLPEKHKWVITSEIIKGLSEPTIFIASFEGDRWRNYGGSTPENITHWMPLPQPPTK